MRRVKGDSGRRSGPGLGAAPYTVKGWGTRIRKFKNVSNYNFVDWGRGGGDIHLCAKLQFAPASPYCKPISVKTRGRGETSEISLLLLIKYWVIT